MSPQHPPTFAEKTSRLSGFAAVLPLAAWRAKAQRRHRDPAHIFDRPFSSILSHMEGSKMYMVYGLIILAMIFFLALPITDARTVRMKLSVVSSLGVLLAVSVVVPRLLH